MNKSLLLLFFRKEDLPSLRGQPQIQPDFGNPAGSLLDVPILMRVTWSPDGFPR
jgi:hypothetical protein